MRAADILDQLAWRITESARTFSWYDVADHLEKVSPGTLDTHPGIAQWLSGFHTWKLTKLTEDQINDDTLYSDRHDWREIVDRYAQMDPATMPPIVVAPDSEGHDGKWHIIDGRHRAMACFKRGQKVPAYAPAGIKKKRLKVVREPRPVKPKKESPQLELPLASLLGVLADRITALHYRDFLGQTFDDFRKKYAKLFKAGQAYGVFIQFTSHAKDPLDRNPFLNPDHKDPAGVYGYPLEYVLKHPADIWYGQGARYMRVLKSATRVQQVLDLQQLTESQAYDMLARIGAKKADGTEVFRATDVQQWMRKVAKEFKNRLQGGNKIAKIFFLCMQQVGPDDFTVLSAEEQNRRFKKLGFRALLDTGHTNKQAIINDREPEQIVFLDRTAFKVLETYQLHGKDSGVKTHFDEQALDRPTAAKIASILGDSLTGEKERSSLGGWTYWWTKKGRRIELKIENSARYYEHAWDKLKWGEKRHKADKLHTPHEANLIVRTEIGLIRQNAGEKDSLDTLLKEVAADWEWMVQHPEQTDWKPETKKEWKEARTAEWQERYGKEQEEKYAKERDYFVANELQMLIKLGAPPPHDLDLTSTFVGTMAHELETMHHAIVRGRDGKGQEPTKVFEEFTGDLPAGAPYEPYNEYVRNIIWPVLRESYTKYPEELRKDWIEDIGKPKYLESWLKFLVSKAG